MTTGQEAELLWYGLLGLITIGVTLGVVFGVAGAFFRLMWNMAPGIAIVAGVLFLYNWFFQEHMKGVLIVLLFTGQTVLTPFDYTPKDYDGSKGFTDTEIVLSCSEQADITRNTIATHSWDNPKGSGWFLNDGTGTVQGHIC